MATDPVCGIQVDEARAIDAGRVSGHGGERYLFYSPRCKTRFDADPAAALDADQVQAPQPHGAAPTTPAAREQVCPMHPQIVRDAPGSGPICGMALEPRVAAAREGDDPELRSMQRRLWISAALRVPILALAMGDMLPGAPVRRVLGPRLTSWLQLALGTGAAYVHSVVATLAPGVVSTGVS